MRHKFTIIFLLALSLATGSNIAAADEGLLEAIFSPFRHKEVVAVKDAQYLTECGACHYAYPPGLLPSKSWEKLLSAEALSRHFGENAELDKETLLHIYNYALANAADKSFYKRSRKIAQSTAGGEAPLRITEVRYIKRKHHELPRKMVQDNKDVKSLSNCDACHTRAGNGEFDTDTVKVPNFPNWDE